MIVFAEELEQWLWEEGMWLWLSTSNGGNSAGEAGVWLCATQRGRYFLVGRF